MAHYNEVEFYALSFDGSKKSNTWKLIIEKDEEIYCMSKQNGKDIKISIHKSGEVHIALTSEYAKRADIKNQERYFKRFNLAKLTDKRKTIDAKDIDLTKKFEIAGSVLFLSTELKNDVDETEDSKAGIPLKFSKGKNVMNVLICISCVPKFKFNNISWGKEIFRAKLPRTERTISLVVREYRHSIQIRSILKYAYKKKKQLVPRKERKNYMQATIGTVNDWGVESVVEINYRK